MTPASLHPVAAASFTDILQNKLHSLLCVIEFRHDTRGLGGSPTPGWHFHFAQTFPFRRRGLPTGAFHWLTADPRPGVEIDLRQLPLHVDPRDVFRDWCQLELAFGISRTQRATRFRFYICPTLSWLAQHDAEEEQEEVWSRGELAGFLEREAEFWFKECGWYASLLGLPKYEYAYREDTEMLEAMKKLPCTAIGMWLFPAEAFKEPTIPHRLCFDVRTARPGLFLFEV